MDPAARKSGLTALAAVTSLNFACDAILAVALANTLFFAAATAESEQNVALYLALTIAPFALLAPILGPLLDRWQSGQRLSMSLSFSVRAFFAILLALNFSTWLLYPLSLGILVTSKSFGIVRASVTPAVAPPSLNLVNINSRLTIVGHVWGTLTAGGLAAILVKVGSHTWPLWLLAIAATIAAYLCFLIPATDGDPQTPTAGTPSDTSGWIAKLKSIYLPEKLTTLTRVVVANCATNRLITGFLTLFLAFVVKEQSAGSAVAQASLLATFGAMAAAGTFCGNWAGSHIRVRAAAHTTLGALTVSVVALSVAAVYSDILGDHLMWLAPVVGVCAAMSSITKVTMDTVVQQTSSARFRASIFGRVETVLQLSWVCGGGLGILLPAALNPSFIIVAVIAAAALLVALGSFVVASYMND